MRPGTGRLAKRRTEDRDDGPATVSWLFHDGEQDASSAAPVEDVDWTGLDFD